MNNRRKLVIALGASALAGPLSAIAQAKPPVLIGWLDTGSRSASTLRLAAFREGLAALGLKEGSDYRLEERWAEGRVDQLQLLAGELAAKDPAIILAQPSIAVRAAAKAAPKTPIILVSGNPVATGLVTSLARPGGMITGLSNVQIETDEKLLELLLAAAPKLRQVGFLADSTTVTGVYDASVRSARRAAEYHRIKARFADAARMEDIEPAIARLAKEGAQALILLTNTWFNAERPRFVRLALQHRWPLVASQSEFAELGALLTYGVDRIAMHRRAAYYVDRILKGAKPGDLPIEQPTKFELVVNMKTAKALGLNMRDLLFRADKVIK